MDITIRTDPVTEHAVVVSLRLTRADDPEVPQPVDELSRQIEVVLASVRGGEFGGTDTGRGYCVLYCYGDDADEVFEAIEPILYQFGPEPGSWAIKRYGSATDRSVPRERVDLASVERT